MERLRNGLSVTASGQSEVITVAFRALAAREAKTIADAVVKSFQGYRSRTFNEGDVQRMTELSAKYEEAQKEIKRILGQRSVVAHEAKTPDAQQLRLPLAKRREELLSERSTLDRQLQMEHWERRAFADAAEGGNAAASRPYHEDGEWRELHRALQNARHELEKARQQLGDSHPKIIERQSDEQHAQKLLDERQAQLDQYWESAVAQLNAPGDSSAAARQLPLELRISRDEQALKLLGQEIAALEEKIDWTEDRATQLTQFDEELRQQRELSDLVFTQMQALETESKAPLDIQIQLAPEPSRPDRDRRILFCIMALVAGLMTGVGLAYLRAIMDPTFRDLGDVRGTMQLPFLGQLPELPARSDVATEANPQLIESIRMVRTALLARFPDTTCRSVLVTSSSPQAGKSTFVVLLARSLASLGKRVLLVEADFHHPCLAERLQLESAAGLVMLLAGTVDDDRAIIHTAVPQLDVIPVGPPAPGIDTDTLANGQFAACLRRWRANYDFILLDSPPMRPVADARILSRHADGTIMLLRSSRCHKVEVIEAYADLSAAGGTLLGTVLVGGERRGGYYSYSYEYARQRGSNYLPKA
jgi:capsular exopolysaccharide synthesis family protein